MMMSSMETRGKQNVNQKSASRVPATLSRLFACTYLVLLTYFILSNDNDELEPINNNMLFYLTCRICSYWVILICWFLAMNFRIFGNSFYASQQYFGEMYRGILPFWRRPKARSLHEVLVINKDIEQLEGGGVQIDLLKSTQAILSTHLWTDDCQTSLERLAEANIPITILISNTSAMEQINQYFKAQPGDYFIVALDRDLCMSKLLKDDATLAFASRPLRHLLCPCARNNATANNSDHTNRMYLGEMGSTSDNKRSSQSMIYLLDSNARIAWYGSPNKCATDICRWHSLPDEVRYSKYVTETTIDESKWNVNYPTVGIIILFSTLVWVVFNAAWSFYGFSCLVDISNVSNKELQKIDQATWNLTYIDSAIGLLICVVPFFIFVLLITLTLIFALLLAVFAFLFNCTYHSVPDIIEEE
jgi:hypothetical protein